MEAGADAIGLVFAHDSPRRIDPAQAGRIVADLPPMVTAVGVFRDQSPAEAASIADRVGAQVVQVHGRFDESDAASIGRRVIRAVRFDEATIGEALDRLRRRDEVTAVLVDGSVGGGGEAFDWSALARHRDAFAKRLIVAGGLSPENVGEAIGALRPFAVDVTSGVEAATGRKDPALIRAFCKAVRDADAGG